jgi:hypothetical protein
MLLYSGDIDISKLIYSNLCICKLGYARIILKNKTVKISEMDIENVSKISKDYK